MKRNLLSPFQFAANALCILIVILLQLPAISLAFDFRTSQPPIGIFSPPPNNSAFTVFSNPASISVTDRAGAATPNGISTPYPSVINVSGMSGTITDVNVTVTGLTTARERDLNFAVVAPNGAALMLLADGGNLFTTSNVNLTFDDSAATTIGTGAAITTGTYQPTDHLFSGTDSDDFPAPGPASVNSPAPEGVATLASTFNGITPNGNWGLYIVDDSLGGGTSSVSGGWSIDITTALAVEATNTGVISSVNPSLTGQSVTFTSTTTVVSSGLPVSTGTVSFTQNAVAITGCTNVAVNASGQAGCTTSALGEGTRNIVANYSGTATLGVSSGSLSQVINSPTVVTGAQFCNNGGLTITDAGTAAPVYPSNIAVSGLFGTISNVNATINGFNAPRPGNIDFMLVGPGGQAYEFMGDAGDSVNPFNGNLVLSDSGATLLPASGAFAPGTYRPTDNDTITPDSFPAPAPAGASQAAPVGAATFASVYSSLNPNGNWSLYAVDDGIGGGNTPVGGWCVTFTLAKFATTTILTSSQNPSLVGQSVTFTATVTSAAGTPTGSVEFFDGATSLGTVALNGAGVATLATSALPQGTRNVNAQYLGANIGAGGGGYAASNGAIGGGQVVTNTATWDGSTNSDWNTPANWNVNVVPGPTNSVNLPSSGVTNQPVLSAANTTVADLTVGANRTLTIGATRTLTVNGVLTMNGLNIDATGANALLEIGGAGSIVRTSGVVLGPMRKIVTSAPIASKNSAAPAFVFEYPVGTSTGFSPLSANFTAGSGSLTVAAFNGTAPSTPALNDATTLDRYWQLTETGSLTASLTFTYLQADVDGAEANYRMIRSSAGAPPIRFPNGTPCPGAGSPCVDGTSAAGGTIFANVQSFDNFWTAGEPVAPTAANVEVAGRVFDSSGRAVAYAIVTMTDANGNTRQSITNAFGYYSFTGIGSGRDYVFNVASKGHSFQARVVSINDNVADLDFVASP